MLSGEVYQSAGMTLSGEVYQSAGKAAAGEDWSGAPQSSVVICQQRGWWRDVEHQLASRAAAKEEQRADRQAGRPAKRSGEQVPGHQSE